MPRPEFTGFPANPVGVQGHFLVRHMGGIGETHSPKAGRTSWGQQLDLVQRVGGVGEGIVPEETPLNHPDVVSFHQPEAFQSWIRNLASFMRRPFCLWHHPPLAPKAGIH
jgi:hypothetical protein